MIWTLLMRDLGSRLRDRSALVLAVIAPIALVTVLSLLMGGPDTKKIPVGFAPNHASTLSQALHDGPLKQLSDDHVIALTMYADRAEITKAIDKGTVDAGIAVDGDSVDVIKGGGIVAGAIAEAVARSTAATVDGVTTAVAADRMRGGKADPETLAKAVLAAKPALDLGDATPVGVLDTKAQLAAGMATLFLFFAVQFGVLGLLEERRSGTLPRLLAAPLAPWKILASKVLTSLVLGLISMTLLISYSSLALGAHWGNWVGVALLTVSGVLAAVATVTLVAGVAKSSEQAAAIQGMLAMGLAILGGSFFSVARSGGIAAILSRITPHYWYGEGLARLAEGGTLTAIRTPVLVLLAFALVVGVPGLMLAKRTVRA